MGALIDAISPDDANDIANNAVTFAKLDRGYQSGRVVMTVDSATAAGEDSTVTLPHSFGAGGTDSIHCFAQMAINDTPDSVSVYAYASDTAQITITAKSADYPDDTVGINWFAVWTG